MDNSIDTFIDACKLFRVTPTAKTFIKTNNLILPSSVSEAIFHKWSKEAPTLDPQKSIFPILKKAEDSFISSSEKRNTLLSILNIEQRFSTSEVIIITEKDNDKTIPVYNRNWLLHSATNKNSHSIITECKIPTPEENNDYKLGCYLPESGTILLWIDRIFNTASKSNISTLLLFQMILLHELIHSVLDCNKRDQALSVFSCDDNINAIEETIDNTLVLMCYDQIDESIYLNSIKDIISSQPSNYALAVEVYDNIKSNHIQSQFVGFITIFLVCKLSGKKNFLNLCMYFIVSIDNEENEENIELPKDIIKDSSYNLSSDIPGKLGNFKNSDYEEFQAIRISDCQDGLIEIKGDNYRLSNVDFISEITKQNDDFKTTITAVFILKNEKKDDFIMCSFPYYDVDNQEFIESLSISGLEKSSDGAYYVELEDIAKLFDTLYPDRGRNWFNIS